MIYLKIQLTLGNKVLRNMLRMEKRELLTQLKRVKQRIPVRQLRQQKMGKNQARRINQILKRKRNQIRNLIRSQTLLDLSKSQISMTQANIEWLLLLEPFSSTRGGANTHTFHRKDGSNLLASRTSLRRNVQQAAKPWEMQREVQSHQHKWKKAKLFKSLKRKEMPRQLQLVELSQKSRMLKGN